MKHAIGRKHIVSSLSVAVLALLLGFSPLVPVTELLPADVHASEVAAPSDAQIFPGQEILANLYETKAPSVVSLQVTKAAAATEQAPALPFPFPQPQEPEQEFQTRSQGTGWIWDTDGHIVTNNHVVEGAETITVNFTNGQWARGELVARDPQADLAVVKVDAPRGVILEPLPLANPVDLKVGHYVVAIGSPFGLAETMTLGIVSAQGRSFPMGEAGGPTYSLPDVIQTDTAINPGNSGGPLLNLEGEVVGVNFAINSPVRANSGVGFAIPTSVVQKVVPALISGGAYDYAFLGISGSTITAGVAENLEIEEGQLGVYVAGVVADGPAARAGVQDGDILVGAAGESISSFEDLLSVLFRQGAPGVSLSVDLLRQGTPLSVQVTLGARPGGARAERSAPTPTPVTVDVSEAIQIAKQAVANAEMLTVIDSAVAQRETRDGSTVWVVTIAGQDKEATVVVDAGTGDVISLSVR